VVISAAMAAAAAAVRKLSIVRSVSASGGYYRRLCRAHVSHRHLTIHLMTSRHPTYRRYHRNDVISTCLSAAATVSNWYLYNGLASAAAVHAPRATRRAARRYNNIHRICIATDICNYNTLYLPHLLPVNRQPFLAVQGTPYATFFYRAMHTIR